MRTNADLTLYTLGVNPTTRSETWTRSVIYGVTWENRRGVRYTKEGSIKDDGVTVYIPMAHYPTSGLKPGDVIVRDVVNDVIGPSFTIGALRAKYPESATVKDIAKMDMGSLSLQHYQVEGQ